MFERFTDRARRVLVLAQEEARMLNHSFIGTEHILLGLIHERDGVAAKALGSLQITLEEVRERVEETIGMAGSVPSGPPPFTPRAKKVMELALREALQFGHSYIGTEHLLLGLVREGEGVAAQVLVSLGADLGGVRQQVLAVMSGVPVETVAGPRERNPARMARIRGELVSCSFCGRRPPASGQLVAGNDAFICEQCVAAWSVTLRRTGPADPFVSERLDVSVLPPADEDAARAEIAAAFSNLGMLSEDGQSLPMVEGGENLGPTRVAAAEQHPDIEPVAVMVDRVAFVDAERAEVWFHISLGDSRVLTAHRGDAVVVDGDWKVARSTFCDLMEMAGVDCPPPQGAAAG